MLTTSMERRINGAAKKPVRQGKLHGRKGSRVARAAGKGTSPPAEVYRLRPHLTIPQGLANAPRKHKVLLFFVLSGEFCGCRLCRRSEVSLQKAGLSCSTGLEALAGTPFSIPLPSLAWHFAKAPAASCARWIWGEGGCAFKGRPGSMQKIWAKQSPVSTAAMRAGTIMRGVSVVKPLLKTAAPNRARRRLCRLRPQAISAL